mmetsp:Transcript_7102/g.13061  ORF Transcript_7102/g.13061 Transcript_7102/m.13061 type:complete len:110 (+) Transcript_7102:47-376(+)
MLNWLLSLSIVSLRIPRHPNCMCKPYLDTLPTKDYCFSPTPDFLSDEEIWLFSVMEIIQRVKERKQQIIATSMLESTRRIAVNDHVTITYGTGNETSAELFAKYGFGLE